MVPWHHHLVMEKEMATHSSSLAWKSPWTEESGRLQSMESQRVNRTSDFTSLHLLDGHEFEQTLGDGEGQRSLVGCSPCSYKESNTT